PRERGRRVVRDREDPADLPAPLLRAGHGAEPRAVRRRDAAVLLRHQAVTESSTGSTSVGDVAKPDAELHARWPLQPLPSLSIRNVLLAVIVVVQLCTAIVGIDWGLPYLWNSDEKIDPVAQMLWQHTLDPHYFVNPTLAIYEVLAVARISYALHPRKVVEISLRHIVPLTW